MNKKILIGCILAVALLTLVSLSNVVGYNTIKTAKEELIASEFDFEYCKDYLFETIVDISNNQEVKDLINSKTQYQRSILPFRKSNVDLKVEHLELLYKMGLKIIDMIGEDKVEELMENIEDDNPEIYEQIDKIVMGNDKLRDKFYFLNKINDEKINLPPPDWEFPIICAILIILTIPLIFIVNIFGVILVTLYLNPFTILFIPLFFILIGSGLLLIPLLIISSPLVYTMISLNCL